jgi:hypothetical protein
VVVEIVWDLASSLVFSNDDLPWILSRGEQLSALLSLTSVRMYLIYSLPLAIN